MYSGMVTVMVVVPDADCPAATTALAFAGVSPAVRSDAPMMARESVFLIVMRVGLRGSFLRYGSATVSIRQLLCQLYDIVQLHSFTALREAEEAYRAREYR